jgi:hypothetical protein
VEIGETLVETRVFDKCHHGVMRLGTGMVLVGRRAENDESGTEDAVWRGLGRKEG